MIYYNGLFGAVYTCTVVQRRGHVVWLDIERLSAGIDWEEGIAGGLSWVRDAGQDGRVLLVMTPHALRRPDGYCLNEVARAASLRLNIFPVMVAESAPPPSIAMLPFFDMRDCVPGESVQLTHVKESSEWRLLMKSCLETSTFLDKAERLYTILELVRYMYLGTDSIGVSYVALKLNEIGLTVSMGCFSLIPSQATAFLPLPGWPIWVSFLALMALIWTRRGAIAYGVCCQHPLRVDDPSFLTHLRMSKARMRAHPI